MNRHTGQADSPAEGAPLRYGEDLRVGQRFELGSHRVEEAELVDFASQWDPQWFHVDGVAAQEGPFEGLIASGIHTLAILTRLTYAAIGNRWALIAGRGLRDLRFRHPVRPGDVLTGFIVVRGLEFDDRGRVLLTTENTLVEQGGQPVLTTLLDAYLHARPSGQAPD